ncbi:Ras guanine nucleotide exchange factor L [Diplonema papillatum]|nr:Ras guanine nucleotide exchange factor L [Diplonema papillatum]
MDSSTRLFAAAHDAPCPRGAVDDAKCDDECEASDIAAVLSHTALDAPTLSLSDLRLSRFPDNLTSRFAQLTTLDLSRNKIKSLPTAVGTLSSLVTLDLSRNEIRALPEDLRNLKLLERLLLLSNKLNHNSIPYAALRELTALKHLDLRFNTKCSGENARQTVRSAFPDSVTVLVTIPVAKENRPVGGEMGGLVGEHACERDATQLRSQLEPWSTPLLRDRLRYTFHIASDFETEPREAVMQKLLAAYAALFPAAEYPMGRRVRRVENGFQVSDTVCRPLYDELIRWQTTRDPSAKERPTIRAEGYMILRSHLEFTKHNGTKATLAAQKVAKHQALWDLAAKVMVQADPVFATKYTAVAFTDNFTGSPHIDTQNIGPFYGIALGDFDGGELCVESTPTEVAMINTRYRAVKVDGRYPHWVAPHTGQRFSVIYYQTFGDVTPMAAAVLV